MASRHLTPLSEHSVLIADGDPDEGGERRDWAEEFLVSRLNWSAHHRENARSILRRFAAFVAEAHLGGPELVSPELVDVEAATVRAFFAARAGQAPSAAAPPVSGTTAHKDYQILSLFYGWASEGGFLPLVRRRVGREIVMMEPPPTGPLHGVAAPKMTEPHPRRIRRLSEADYYRIIAGFDRRRLTDRRDAAICSLMYWSGPRRSEVVRADRANYRRDGGRGGALLLVKGKGDKWRIITVLDETRRLIDNYLAERRDDDNTALFASSRGAGRLRPDAVSAMLDRRCAKLGLDGVASHQFRRAATSEAKAREIPETEIARQLGWAPQSAKLMIPRYTQADADKLTEDSWRATDPTARRRRRTGN